MPTRVYINAQITPPEEAKISVFDRGFLYGDSVYEVMRSSGGNLVDLEAHLARLRRSAESIALAMPGDSEIRQAVQATLDSANNAESYVRIVVTRGGGEVGLDTSLADRTTLIVIVKELTLPAPDMYSEGVSLAIVDVQRTSAKAVDPSVKSGNYLNNILALAAAKKEGAYEAVMCDGEGWLAEGSSSNIFLVREGVLYTPELSVGLLAGITRRRILSLAEARGIECNEGRLRPEELRSADEAFITSSIRGILPVTRVDSQPISGGRPGPMCSELMQAYQAFLEAEAES